MLAVFSFQIQNSYMNDVLRTIFKFVCGNFAVGVVVVGAVLCVFKNEMSQHHEILLDRNL